MTLAAETLSAKTLAAETPPEAPALLKGTVSSQFVRCGRAGCKCGEGALHGPYYYRVWREGGKVCKAYVRAADLEAVMAACARYSECKAQAKALRVRCRELTRRVRQQARRARTLARDGSAGQLKAADFP